MKFNVKTTTQLQLNIDIVVNENSVAKIIKLRNTQ